MKTLLALLAIPALAFAALPAKKVSTRLFPDGTGSTKEIDPEKHQSTESFVDASGKMTYKIIYQLDERMQPLSGVYYNAVGKVFQKSAYKVDGADRIIQEVVYDAKDRLACTKNFIYGTRSNKSALIGVDIYDANGVLKQTQKKK